MSVQRPLAILLSATLILGGPTAWAAQPSTGPLVGRISDESKRPFVTYAVQLRDTSSGKLLTTEAIDPQGRFVFKAVPIGAPYLLELVRVKDSRIVCTAGPYVVNSDPKLTPSVDLDCGRTPAGFWVLAAAAGTAGLLAIADRSFWQGGTPSPVAATQRSSGRGVSPSR